ncbi:uncharacterized protein B0H18DRAFT_1105128 [Fomitopsis serialis]|uniref:uncharacterized protein n=1 Tax=Fomitopsis serialis TaxID=139415 RepID=UPI0020077AA9|nr:uncharacterized protein B0H18DRAFT_1105128 [Neoantrodia serialis]KAH9924033.1 hypothetical protein B0H18DRAFT_1105128 [Neoantrodia serialis]
MSASDLYSMLLSSEDSFATEYFDTDSLSSLGSDANFPSPLDNPTNLSELLREFGLPDLPDWSSQLADGSSIYHDFHSHYTWSPPFVPSPHPRSPPPLPALVPEPEPALATQEPTSTTLSPTPTTNGDESFHIAPSMDDTGLGRTKSSTVAVDDSGSTAQTCEFETDLSVHGTASELHDQKDQERQTAQSPQVLRQTFRRNLKRRAETDEEEDCAGQSTLMPQKKRPRRRLQSDDEYRPNLRRASSSRQNTHIKCPSTHIACRKSGCQQTFTRERDRDRHESVTHEQRRVQCLHCNLILSRADSAERHSRNRHRGKPLWIVAVQIVEDAPSADEVAAGGCGSTETTDNATRVARRTSTRPNS